MAEKGFVPTMGALHAGHAALISAARKRSDEVIVSVFVNPLQFNDPEDLKKYPRTPDKDREIALAAGATEVWFPTYEEIYPAEPERIEAGPVGDLFEGASRPGHFSGMLTVVKRLFDLVQPDFAVFGEKDFQQLQIVKKLVEKEKISVKIIGCPIFREPNGLAMSSRNERLSAEEKEKAAIIFKTLNNAKTLFGTKSAKNVSDFVSKTFQNHPIFELEYFEIADETTLLPCTTKNNSQKYRAFIAVFVNNVRLIDTISLN